jgi:hypothetical protein
MKRQRFRTAHAAFLTSAFLFRIGNGSSADTITFDPAPPDQRPTYSCLGAPEYLAMCAAKWMRLVHDGKPTGSQATYWYAAEFQGFVYGVAQTTGGRRWCPGILESYDQVYTAVAEYLVTRRDHLPKDRGSVEVVITALSTWAPCKQSR